jgi:hypothetical protein
VTDSSSHVLPTANPDKLILEMMRFFFAGSATSVAAFKHSFFIFWHVKDSFPLRQGENFRNAAISSHRNIRLKGQTFE